MGVFDKYTKETFKHRFRATIHVDELHGGVPLDPKTAAGWIRSKMEIDENAMRELVHATMREVHGLKEEYTTEEVNEAIEAIAAAKTKNTFKRLPDTGELYIEGRQVKSMIKENANIQWPKERWGPSNKGTRSYFAEHVFVEEMIIPLGRTEPDGESTRFIAKYIPGRGQMSAIQTEDFVADVKLTFTVATDNDFHPDLWGQLWASAQLNGLGAARSQGYGQFDVVAWDRL